MVNGMSLFYGNQKLVWKGYNNLSSRNCQELGSYDLFYEVLEGKFVH